MGDYKPWEADPLFCIAFEKAQSRTLLSTQKAFTLWSFARYAAPLEGGFAECGVYKGGSALLAGLATNGVKPLHLFDTFIGIPPGDPQHDNRYISGGEFGDTSEEDVTNYLIGNGINPASLHIHKGMIPQTFRTITTHSFSFVHIDVDIYSSTRDCLEFFHPKMASGGIIVVDDYGAPECAGARKAVNEFSGSVSRVVLLTTGQAVSISGITKDGKDG
jgi:O-methyltransferase